MKKNRLLIKSVAGTVLFLLFIVITNGCNRIVNNKNKNRNSDSTQVSQKVLSVRNRRKLIDEERKRIKNELITLIQGKWLSFKPDTIHDKLYNYTYQIQMDISDSKYLALYGEIVDAGSLNQKSSIMLFREDKTDKFFQINIPTRELKKIVKEDTNTLEGFFLVNNIQISPLITTRINSVPKVLNILPVFHLTLKLILFLHAIVLIIK